MGHPNLGTKALPRTQDAIRQSGQILPWSSAIIYAWMPKSSPGVKSPNAHSSPRPDTKVRLFRGLTGRRATSISPKVSPPRPLAARYISASPEGKGSPSERRRIPPRSRPPRPTPLRGLGAGGTPPLSRPPRQTGAMTQPLDGTGAFIANHSMEWSRSQTASAATPHDGRDRSPVCLFWSL